MSATRWAGSRRNVYPAPIFPKWHDPNELAIADCLKAQSGSTEARWCSASGLINPLEDEMENSELIVAAILAHALIGRLGREPDAKVATATWREVLGAMRAAESREIERTTEGPD